MSRYIACSAFMFLSATANAAMLISNISYTSNSLTFTIDGDMSGYSEPVSDNRTFSIVYGGDIFNEALALSYTPHTISGELFDNIPMSPGNTGNWNVIVWDPARGNQSFSWNHGGFTSLATAVATNNTVTINMADDYLDPLATNPVISFYWGSGLEAEIESTLLYTTAVPIPAAVWLFGSALAGLGWLRRKQTV
jgi:hypothetical protein